MFQRDTIVHYVKKFENRDITEREAIEIAINPIRAQELAEKIIFNEPDGWKNWLNCANKLGIPKELEIIRKLEQ